MDIFNYEVKLPNENHEEIVLKCEVWGSDKTPCVELEVPAYSDEKNNVKQPRMYVTMTLEEFDNIIGHVEKYRKALSTIKD